MRKKIHVLEWTPEVGSEAISYLKKPILREYHRLYEPHGMVFDVGWASAFVEDVDGQKK